CVVRLDECLSEKIPECVKECIEKCKTILEAMLCVLILESTCQGMEPQCLIKGLVTCKERLDTAYAACLEKCMQDCLSLKKTVKYPNSPYLPQATKITVSYSTQCSNPPVNTEEAC